jgi:hypothetical protein
VSERGCACVHSWSWSWGVRNRTAPHGTRHEARHDAVPVGVVSLCARGCGGWRAVCMQFMRECSGAWVFYSPIRRGTLSGVVLRRTSGLRVRANLVNSILKHLNYRSPARTGRTNKGKNWDTRYTLVRARTPPRWQWCMSPPYCACVLCHS